MFYIGVDFDTFGFLASCEQNFKKYFYSYSFSQMYNNSVGLFRSNTGRPIESLRLKAI